MIEKTATKAMNNEAIYLLVTLKYPLFYSAPKSMASLISLYDNTCEQVNELFSLKTKRQAWSNDVYKSVEHRVMASKMERYSVAYFLCPSYDSFFGSCSEPSIYRKFTFREYRMQVQDDVKKMGRKVGLSRFLLKDQSLHTRIVQG